jgi:nucleoside phosphorylase
MKPLKVLFVEDELHKKTRVLDAIKANPELFDQPDVVETTAGALERLKAERYDLLLADLILPRQYRGDPSEANGLDLLESVSQLDEGCGAAYTLSISRADQLTPETQKFFSGRPWGLLRYRDDTTSFLDDLISIAQYIQKAQTGQAAKNPEVDVLIITALLEPEFAAVERALPSLGPKLPLDVRQYYRLGELSLSDTHKVSVAAAHCERMGPVHAAVSASKLCQALNPKLVVMAGICAGYPKKTSLGDVVAAETSWLWQDGKYSVVDGTPGFQGSPHQVHVSPAVKFCLLDMKRDERVWNAFGTASRKVGVVVPKLVTGPVATSVAVLADAKVRDSIAQTQHRAVVGIDMETYSVYVAAESSHSVAHFVSLKAVCDGGDKGKDDEYQAYAAEVSAETALAFIKRFFGA